MAKITQRMLREGRTVSELLESRTMLAVQPAGELLDTAAYDPTRIVVQFRKGDCPSGDDIMQGTSVGKRVGLARRLHVVELGKGVSVKAALNAYRHNPHVEFAEPNWIYTHQATSNDPVFTNGDLWGMYGNESAPANDFGSQAAEVWAAGQTGSSEVYVGIIDEGIDISHPDLAPNAWVNPYDPKDGIDNDGNGYVDDVNGWDFVKEDASVYDGSADDHGTHVAGTIAAAGGNGIGVAGVAWDVTYIAGKFLGAKGGSTIDAIQAVDYFTDLKMRHGMNIVATNNSWGGGPFSQALLDAITRGAKANIIFISAAGNGGSDKVGDNNDSVTYYPANYDTTPGAGYDAVVSVAAIGSVGQLASFSNYGAQTVDLAAPGLGIVSTMPGGGYGTNSGTSMATPHVTGAAALYAAAHPNATGPTIREALLGAARMAPTASLAGRTVTGGRLDVSLMLEQTPVPAAPTNPLAEAGSASEIRITWVDRSVNETGFVVERWDATAGADGTGAFVVAGTVGANVTTFIDSGLSADTTYTYRVAARNDNGTSAFSPEVSARTNVYGMVPDAPADFAATPLSSNQVSLTWKNTATDSTGFVLQRSTSPDFSNPTNLVIASPTATAFMDSSGLVAATTYYYRLAAKNSTGNSAYVFASATTALPVGTGAGLTGKYYDYNSTSSQPPSTALAFSSLKLTRTDPTVNFNWGTGSPGKSISRDTFAVRWTGQIEPRFSDIYTFTVMADDGVRLWIDGKLVVDGWRINWGNLEGSTYLTAGKHDFQMDYFENNQGAMAQLHWSTASGNVPKEIIPRSQLYPTMSGQTAIITAAGATIEADMLGPVSAATQIRADVFKSGSTLIEHERVNDADLLSDLLV